MTFVPEADRPPVDSMTPAALHAELVADAVARHPTDLRRYVLACRRIAEVEHKPVEDVHTAVLDAVEALTGERKMPMW